MGRKKAAVRKKGATTPSQMRRALDLHLKSGQSIRKAAKECGIPYQTLQKYTAKARNGNLSRFEPNYSVNKVFSGEEEKELYKYIVECADMFYGLTAKDCRRVAFQIADKNNIKMPGSWLTNQMAGKEWLRGFRSRFPDISLKKPEGCSLGRAIAFNKANIEKFFRNLKIVLERHDRFGDGSRIYNLDETSTTTVQRPQKVLAAKGRSVCKVTSGERGVLVTTCCIVSAYGQALPPALVFPRKNFKCYMLNGAPPGTLGLASPSGWMNSELFVEVMGHFIKNTSASKENPALLIIDNHESHLSIKALDLAKANGVTVLTLHPHTTAKMQPLDVGLLAPFKTFYNAAVDSFLLRNPGKGMTIYNVAEFVGIAYPKAMTPTNITNAFKKCGIFPYDDQIFTEIDFLPSTVTDRSFPEEDAEKENVKVPAKTVQGNVETKFISPKEFLPPIKAQPRKKTQTARKRGKSIIATDTPEKEALANNKRQSMKSKTKIDAKRTKRDLFEEKIKGKKKTKITSISDSSTDSDEEFKCSGSSSGGEGFLSESEDEDIILVEDFQPLTREPHANDYVLIRFKSKNDNVYYVAQIIEKMDGDEECDFYVSYLKLKSKVQQKFVEPLEPDMAGVKMQDIKYVLPPPKLQGSSRRKSTFKFPVNLKLLNLRY